MAAPDPDALAQLQRQHAALQTACEQDPRYHYDACAFAHVADLESGYTELELECVEIHDRRDACAGIRDFARLEIGLDDAARSAQQRLQWSSHEKYVDIANLAFLYYLRQCRFYYKETWAGIVRSFTRQNGYHAVRTASKCYELCDTKKVITMQEHSARAEKG